MSFHIVFRGQRKEPDHLHGDRQSPGDPEHLTEHRRRMDRYEIDFRLKMTIVRAYETGMPYYFELKGVHLSEMRS